MGPERRCSWWKTLLQNRPLVQAICPGCLWTRDQKVCWSRVQRLAGAAWGHRGLLSRLEPPTGTKGPWDQWSRMEPPTGTNGGDLVPIGGSNRDKSPLPISLFFLPRASHLAQYSCCSWLGWGGVLAISSTICEDSLIPCPFNSCKG